LAQFVSDTDNLYWEGDLSLLWFKLRRPSYYSCVQGAGAMFFRGTALEFRRRADGLAVLNTEDFSNDKRLQCPLKQNPDQQGPKSSDELRAACRALPDLGGMVLTTLVAGAPHTEWKAPVGRVVERRTAAGGSRLERTDTFYLYRCDDLR
jgi:hypothetical protein